MRTVEAAVEKVKKIPRGQKVIGLNRLNAKGWGHPSQDSGQKKNTKREES